MKTCLDDRSASVNMHHKDFKEQTPQLLSSGQGVLCSVSCKNGALHPQTAVWSAETEHEFGRGKCQLRVSVCSRDALLMDVWPFPLLMEDVLLVKLPFASLNISRHYSLSVRRHTLKLEFCGQRLERLLEDSRIIFTEGLSPFHSHANQRWHFHFQLGTIWPDTDSGR